jgi:alpha 1,6-mannosyltransferase
VGLEADEDPPVPGTTHQVQFCQWTLAAAPSHPAMWKMVDNILEEVQNRPYKTPPPNVEYSDDEVLNITGPAAWTPVVFDFLSQAVGARVDWRNLTGMISPRLYGDILVMPINAFTSGVPHSGSVDGSPDALVTHSFGGSWRGGTTE